MDDYSTLTVSNGSSIDGNAAAAVSSPASPFSVQLMVDSPRGNRRSVAKKERDFATLEPGGDAAPARVSRSQYGGGVYARSSSTVTVTSGSSIDRNTAFVSSPVLMSPLRSWLIRQEAIDTRSLRKRDFAMLELGGDSGLAYASARSTEEALSWMIIPRWR